MGSSAAARDRVSLPVQIKNFFNLHSCIKGKKDINQCRFGDGPEKCDPNRLRKRGYQLHQLLLVCLPLHYTA